MSPKTIPHITQTLMTPIAAAIIPFFLPVDAPPLLTLFPTFLTFRLLL